MVISTPLPSRGDEHHRQLMQQFYATLKDLSLRMHDIAQDLARLDKKLHKCRKDYSDWLEGHKHLAYPNAETINQYLGMWVLLGVSFSCSLVVGFTPLEHLVAQNFVGNTFLVRVATFGLMCLLTAGQVAVGIRYAHLPKGTLIAKSWRLTMLSLSTFSAGLLMVVEVSRYVGLGQWPWPHDVIGIAIKALLAFGLDTTIVFSGKIFGDAFAFILLKLLYIRLHRCEQHIVPQIEGKKSELYADYTDYAQVRYQYQHHRQDTDPPLPRLNQLTIAAFQYWLSLEVE